MNNLHVLSNENEVTLAKQMFPDLPQDARGVRVGWTLNEYQAAIWHRDREMRKVVHNSLADIPAVQVRY